MSDEMTELRWVLEGLTGTVRGERVRVFDLAGTESSCIHAAVTMV